MEKTEKKSKTQILREIQDTVDRFVETKSKIDSLLEELEELELKYNKLKQEAKKN